MVVEHTADVSLDLDTRKINPPYHQATPGRGGRGSENTWTGPQPQEREYRDCGRCWKPEAKLKCACLRLATHYCDPLCQRKDMPDHRQIFTHMILKEITTYQSQLCKHEASHSVFTIEVANLEAQLTGLHIKNGDLFRITKNRTKYEQSEHHYRQAIQILTRLIKKANLTQSSTLIDILLADQAGAYLGLDCLLRCWDQDQEAMVNFERTYDLSKKLTTSKDSSTGHQD